MRLTIVCSLIVFFAVGPAFAQAQSRVRIHVTDAYGNRVPAQRITISADATTKEVPQDEEIGVKYGRYTISVNVPGFSTATESVVIDQPEQIVPIAMRLGVMETPPPRCSIVGHISPAAALSVRLIQVFGSYTANVPVSSTGSFEFRGVECGDYFLIATAANRCIGTRLFRAIPTAGTADIKLDSGDIACISSSDHH